MQAIKGPQKEEPDIFSGVKQRMYSVVGLGKFLFHWGFIPTVIYLGK